MADEKRFQLPAEVAENLGKVFVLWHGWASDSTRETAWNSFIVETMRTLYHHMEETKPGWGWLRTVWERVGACEALLKTQKSKYWQDEVLAVRAIRSDIAAKIVEITSQRLGEGQCPPAWLSELLPVLVKEKNWGETLTSEEVKVGGNVYYMEKRQYTATWRLYFRNDSDTSMEAVLEPPSHPFYVVAMGDKSSVRFEVFEQGDLLEVLFECGGWRFGTERFQGNWSPWRRMRRHENRFPRDRHNPRSPQAVEGSFNPFGADAWGARRQGDAWFSMDQAATEMMATPVAEPHGVEMPTLIQRVRFLAEDGQEVNVTSVELVAVGDSETREGVEARPVYRVTLNPVTPVPLRDGQVIITFQEVEGKKVPMKGKEGEWKVVANHPDHPALDLSGYATLEGDTLQPVFYVAEGRGNTDFRRREDGLD